MTVLWLIIGALYLIVGCLIGFLVLLMSGWQSSMGQAFGYPERAMGLFSAVLIGLFWLPVLLVVLVISLVEWLRGERG
jgi:hypothetical protein